MGISGILVCYQSAVTFCHEENAIVGDVEITSDPLNVHDCDNMQMSSLRLVHPSLPR